MNTLTQYKHPWRQPPLDEWSIDEMRHLDVNGNKTLFVCMKKDGHRIMEQGPDDHYLWNKLWHKAKE